MAELSNFELRHALPASLRKPAQGSGLQGLMARGYQALSDEKNKARTLDDGKLALLPGAFCLIPEEPEDARLTGATRSLPRRLLALNLPGSLRRVRALTPIKAA